MHIEDGWCCLIQHPLAPLAAVQAGVAGEGRHAGVPAGETTAVCSKLIEELHECNVCYSGFFSAETSSVRTGPDSGDGRDVSKAREKQRKAKHDILPELSGSF